MAAETSIHEGRARAARARWRLFAAAAPAALLAGELLYGALAGVLPPWHLLTTPFAMTLVAGIIALRLLRRAWLRGWRGARAPTPAEAARVAANAMRFLQTAWSVAGGAAVFAGAMLLAGAPREYPYVFAAIAIVYFLVYYPRLTVFEDLLWHPGDSD